jgi:predicted Zn-dependent protease
MRIQGLLFDWTADLLKALDLDSELESGWYGRAKVYMRMQELNKARNDLVKALKINPENAIAQRLLDQINLSGGVEKKRPIQGVIGISLQ